LVPNGERITVRQLLNHTSGLAEYCAVPPDSTLCVPPPSEMTRTWTPLQLVEIGVGAAPTFPPGQGFSYSNTDYVLLGMIIEQATGRSLTSSYKRMIFDPLGLKRTSLSKRSTIARPFAHGYDVLAGGNWPLDVTATSPTIAWGAGAIVSVPTDLQRFMRALLAGRLFPKSLLREMKIAAPGSLNGTPPSSPVEGGGVGTYGLGLIHFTWASACGVQGHSGSFPGFHTWAFAAKSGRRGAALYTTADVLPAGGVIAAFQAERTIACRMRFGDVGARKPRG
jgi:D-alanyl-D-alanine carboxypeptidase